MENTFNTSADDLETLFNNRDTISNLGDVSFPEFDPIVDDKVLQNEIADIDNYVSKIAEKSISDTPSLPNVEVKAIDKVTDIICDAARTVGDSPTCNRDSSQLISITRPRPSLSLRKDVDDVPLNEEEVWGSQLSSQGSRLSLSLRRQKVKTTNKNSSVSTCKEWVDVSVILNPESNVKVISNTVVKSPTISNTVVKSSSILRNLLSKPPTSTLPAIPSCSDKTLHSISKPSKTIAKRNSSKNPVLASLESALKDTFRCNLKNCLEDNNIQEDKIKNQIKSLLKKNKKMLKDSIEAKEQFHTLDGVEIEEMNELRCKIMKQERLLAFLDS